VQILNIAILNHSILYVALFLPKLFGVILCELTFVLKLYSGAGRKALLYSAVPCFQASCSLAMHSQIQEYPSKQSVHPTCRFTSHLLCRRLISETGLNVVFDILQKFFSHRATFRLNGTHNMLSVCTAWAKK